MNPPSLSQRTKIVMLGSGTPIADPMRSGPSIAIVVDQTPYIIDFGPGLIRRAAGVYQEGLEGLAVHHLTRAFLTHLHSDHTAGYPDLIFTAWVLGRDEPLEVYGPPGLTGMTNHILAAYSQDIHERVNGLEHGNDQGWRVNAHEIEAGMIYQDELVSVEAFPVRHGSWQAFGYKFITPDRSIVISGDTAPLDSEAEICKGCDVLIHEVYCVEGFQRRPPMWKIYHANMHTSSHDLARLAVKTHPGLLILYHQLFWGTSEQDILDEIATIYDGTVVSGRDLDIY